MKLMLLSFSVDPAGHAVDLAYYYQSQYLKGNIAALEGQGWTVDVFTDNAQNLAQEEKIGRQSRIVRLAGPDGGLIPGEFTTYLSNLLAAVKKWVQERGLHYPLIQSNNWLSGWIGRQLQQDWSLPHVHTPFSLAVGDIQTQEINRYTPLGRRIIEETKTLALADAVVVNCPVERDAIWRRYGLRSVDVQINPYGIDTNLFNGQGGKKTARGRGKKVILYTGGLDGGGLQVLIEALRELLRKRPRFARTIELWILGNPPAQSLRESMDAQQLGQLAHVLAYSEFVRFLGTPSPAETAGYYRTADIAVVPGADKGMGIAALEAMASSCPVIAPRIDQLRHVVLDGETGVLVTPLDSRALAQAVERLLANAGLRKRMGERAANWVCGGFDYQVVGKGWDRIYREVVHKAACKQDAKPKKSKQIC